MKIHAGYEISYTCLQPTPMILMLSVHLRGRPAGACRTAQCLVADNILRRRQRNEIQYERIVLLHR